MSSLRRPLPMAVLTVIGMAVMLLASAASVAADEANIPLGFRHITVTATNHSVIPWHITVYPRQPLKITFVNKANNRANIRFNFPGRTRIMKNDILPGSYGWMLFSAPHTPGTYTFDCPVRGCDWVGTLTVLQPTAIAGAMPLAKVDIVARDTGFSPSDISVLPGQPVRITLLNTGMLTHSILFDFPDGAESVPTDLYPGEAAVLSFIAPFKPGVYEYYSPWGLDRENGMVGILRVVSSTE